MNHCERCGHPLSSHNADGKCRHAVDYGNGLCTCGTHDFGYLRAVVSVPEMVAAALHTAPGRDAAGFFYSKQQAKLVARYAEAWLDQTQPIGSINAIELCEGWADAAAVDEKRWWSIKRDADGKTSVVLRVRAPRSDVPQYFEHTGDTPRDSTAKAIMKAGQAGFGS